MGHFTPKYADIEQVPDFRTAARASSVNSRLHAERRSNRGEAGTVW